MGDEGSRPPPGQGWGPPQGQQPPGQQPPPPPGQQPPPPPGQPPYWGPPQAPYGYGPPPQYGYGPQPQTEGTAITALVLSIASFIVCPLVLAIVALALCPSAQRKIESSRGALTGESLVTAAKIISWINIGIVALVGLFIAVIAIIGAASEDEFSLALSLLAG